MRIALYNTKGSAGKTPIATNIVLDREYASALTSRFTSLKVLFQMIVF